MPGTIPNSLFDRYLVVDWSARSAPATGADSIWIAELTAGGRIELVNPRTRRDARELLASSIERGAGDRILIGIDASLGYPAGTAELFGLTGTPWRAMWSTIADLSTDDDRNRNNRFEVAAELNRRSGPLPGPFWGCPQRCAVPHLAATKPAGFEVGEYRRAERRLREQQRWPASCWQLLGAGSVGSQTLTLLPVLAELYGRFAGRIEIWPFTTGADVPSTGPGGVVVAEVWPTMFGNPEPDVGTARVKDATQVSATASALRAADRSGALAGWLRPELSEAERADVVAEEGWVLGVAGGPHVR